MAEFNEGTDPFDPKGSDEEFSQIIPVGASAGGNIIPDGIYVGKLIEVKKDTAASGNEMYVMDFALTGPPEQQAALGKEFRYWVPITENTMKMLVRTFAALGLPVKEGETLNFKKSDVINRGVTLKIAKSSYNNQERSKIMDVRPHPEGAGYRYEGATGIDVFTPGTAAAPTAPPASAPSASTRPAAPLPSFKNSTKKRADIN